MANKVNLTIDEDVTEQLPTNYEEQCKALSNENNLLKEHLENLGKMVSKYEKTNRKQTVITNGFISLLSSIDKQIQTFYNFLELLNEGDAKNE